MLILSVPSIWISMLVSGNLSPSCCLLPVSILLVLLVSVHVVGLIVLTHVCFLSDEEKESNKEVSREGQKS